MEEIITTETPTPEPIVEETKVEEPKVESPKGPTDEEKQQIYESQAALGLYNALKNPETASDTLKQLARAAGLEITETKSQQVLKKGITDLVREGLGEDNSILADALGPLLEKIIKQEVNERIQPITAQLTENQKNEFAKGIEKTFTDLSKETSGQSDKLEDRMVALMDEVNPGPNTPPEKYIRHIYNLAKSQFDEAERIKAQDSKRESNKKHVAVSTGVNPDRVKSGSKLPTIREAVLAASRGETLED